MYSGYTGSVRLSAVNREYRGSHLLVRKANALPESLGGGCSEGMMAEGLGEGGDLAENLTVQS